MAKSRPSVQKRRKETAKMEKAERKAARKAARHASRNENNLEGLADSGIDPDLAGMVAGPQPTSDDEEEIDPYDLI